MRLIFLSVLLLIICSADATDVEKEQRWAEQVVDFLIDGEAVWLKHDDVEFLSLYTEADEASSKAIIVVHGTGVHPNWDQVVKPVRVEMAGRGWNTLSIQMPILPNEASYEDYVPLYPEVPPRFAAAEAHLKSLGIDEMVIVAHSQGATMSGYYLANHPSDVRAFVAVGMGATQKDGHLNSAESLKKITIPVLDLYGSEDLAGVLDTAEKRKAGASNNPAYEQLIIDEAEHFFDGKNEQLINAVSAWLAKQKS